jgi:polysaccharide biosynthesis/export protein
MQPDKLGVSAWCFVSNALLIVLLLAPSSRAQSVQNVQTPQTPQTVLETPQQVNDRIRSMSDTARVQPHDYIIGSGDVLDVSVFDVPELTREVRVSQTGSIGIPLVPVRLHVAGLTESQTEEKIAEVLQANGLVTNAQVGVAVKERKSKPITVVGAVTHPLVYQADRSVTLLEVLAEAGGIANDAGDTVIVTRTAQAPDSSSDPSEPPAIGPEEPVPPAAQHATPAAQPLNSSAPAASNDPPAQTQGSAAPQVASSAPASGLPPPLPPPPNTITINLNQLMETGDASNNILLQAGDIVTVPHAGIVYVLGAVGKPGGFVVAGDRTQMTTLKILALAGGLNRTAKSDHAVIIRKDSLGQQHEVTVDLKKVVNRQAEDLPLQPSDILYVPDSATKQALLRALEFGVALGSGVALYRVAYR